MSSGSGDTGKCMIAYYRGSVVEWQEDGKRCMGRVIRNSGTTLTVERIPRWKFPWYLLKAWVVKKMKRYYFIW